MKKDYLFKVGLFLMFALLSVSVRGQAGPGSSQVAKAVQATAAIVPGQINGESTIQGVATYTLGDISGSSIVSWAVSINLQIISGQNTNTITVQPISSSVSGEGTIRAIINNKTVETKIWIGLPDPAYIWKRVGYRGDNTIYLKGPDDSYYFEYDYNRAYAEWDAAGEILEYEWSAHGWNIVENTYLVNPTNPIMHEVAFLADNPRDKQAHVTIRARNIFGWGPWSDFTTVNIKSSADVFSVFVSPQSNVIEVVPNNTDNNSSTRTTINYELYNSSTGKLEKNGTLSVNGGSIDVSNILKGIYILNLNSAKKESHKVFIK